MMDLANPEERPRKKPRFFTENAPSPKATQEPGVSAVKEVPTIATNPEQRPRKKPRFFAENTPSPKATQEPVVPAAAEVSTSATESAVDPPTISTEAERKSEDGFDAGLFTAVVGETLSGSDIKKLQSLSGGNIEQGMTLRTSLSSNLTISQRSTSISMALGSQVHLRPLQLVSRRPRTFRLDRHLLPDQAVQAHI
jgi:hypothetical protein